jgi:hypothetical protein
MLDLMQPTRPGGRIGDENWLTGWMKRAGRLRQKRAEGVRHSMPLYVGEARAKRSASGSQRVRFLVHYSMFVRWQRSRTQALIPWRCAKTERTRLKAILVESVRVDGKPRQKHIAFLGSIASDASNAS